MGSCIQGRYESNTEERLMKTKSTIAKDKSQTTLIHCTSGLCVVKRSVPLTLHKSDPPHNFTPSTSLKGSRLEEKKQNSGWDKSGLPVVLESFGTFGTRK